jgi:PAS domain S-box-containing protein
MMLSDQEEHRRLRQMFEQSPGFVALLEGPEHRFALTNAQYLQLVGQRDVIGLAVREALPDGGAQRFFELLDLVFRSGKRSTVRNARVELQRYPGGPVEKRRLDFVYQPLCDAEGRVTSILVQGSDVTGTAGAADGLRAQQERLEHRNADLERMVIERSSERGTTWQVSPHLLSVIDMADGRFVRVNPAWTARLGWSEEELTGASYADFLHPDDLAASFSAFENVRRGMPVLDFENRYRSRSGSYEWLSWVAVPEGGKLYSTSRLVTAEKRREQELEKTQEALRQSQKMEAVGQLTGGIAHDFNNMLAVIIGGLNLIERRLAKDEPVGDLIAATQDGARRAADLTHRLLAFSRQLPLDPKTVDVAGMVKSMSEILNRTLGERIHLETILAAGLWKARTDASQLENALLNLALNARDAMPEGGRLTIETSNAHLDDGYAREYEEVAAGQYVLVAVSDTGEGIAPEMLDKVFEPFFTTKGVGKGTGLGLSQVFGYVKQSGGHIKIYSELAQGTTVKIYLPRAFDDHAAQRTVPRSQTPGGTPREVILLVEDEERMREITAAGLRELGYTVLHTSTGQQALEMLRLYPQIVLLFSDIVMPEMNGRELADEAVKIRPDLKVIFATGYTRNAVVHNGVLDPGVNFLSKPFTLDQLGRKVREVLG